MMKTIPQGTCEDKWKNCERVDVSVWPPPAGDKSNLLLVYQGCNSVWFHFNKNIFQQCVLCPGAYTVSEQNKPYKYMLHQTL